MWAIDMVFVVGGNGGNAGAAAIQTQCEKAGVTCSVIGIPKSIDNDILLVGSPSYFRLLRLFSLLACRNMKDRCG
jgi:6-phosphofructokinase